jgi:hypothetical protein
MVSVTGTWKITSESRFHTAFGIVLYSFKIPPWLQAANESSKIKKYGS